MPGASYGTPGGSLSQGEDTSWAANDGAAAAGRKGEEIVGAALTELVLASDCGVVLHDLQIPIPGISANIDHVIVSGSTVAIIDAKLWRPGFYFTLRRRSYRGFFERLRHLEKRSVAMAHESLTRYLAKHAEVSLPTPLICVAPSSPGRVHTRLLAYPGAEVASLPATLRRMRRLLRREGPADCAAVVALKRLLNGDAGWAGDTGSLAPEVEQSPRPAPRPQTGSARVAPMGSRVPDPTPMPDTDEREQN